MRHLKRWGIFNAVGIAGAGLQLVVLGLTHGWLDLDYTLATALAVEAAVLHNFAWHERWTWADRALHRRDLWGRLWRFHLSNAAISIVGNIVLMRVLVGHLGLHYVPANLAAIVVCSLINYLAGDRFVFSAPAGVERNRELPAGSDVGRVLRTALLSAALLAGLPAPVQAAELKPEAVAAWDCYVRLTEQRIEAELNDGRRFLALDFESPELARAGRALLLRGGVHVSEVHTRAPNGSDLPIPGALVHHWRGAVFVPGARLDQVLSRMRDVSSHEHRQEDVLESRVLARDGDSMRIFLKLARSKIVTVTYNTEHAVGYRWHGPRRASSRSVATRIVELDDAGTPAEREKDAGRDKGFLWRLNSYWRYEQVDGGVVVECESLSLSRSIPLVLDPVVRPIIRQVARESMGRTLEAVRRRVRDG